MSYFHYDNGEVRGSFQRPRSPTPTNPSYSPQSPSYSSRRSPAPNACGPPSPPAHYDIPHCNAWSSVGPSSYITTTTKGEQQYKRAKTAEDEEYDYYAPTSSTYTLPGNISAPSSSFMWPQGFPEEERLSLTLKGWYCINGQLLKAPESPQC